MAIKIGHATIDENGRAIGGKAGDNTKKEVCIRDWYKGNWIAVMRPRTAALAEKSAIACEQACANDKIGYDQGQRNTLYALAKAVNYDLSRVTTACECDCSSLMHVCAIAGGANLAYGSNGFVTSTMAAILVNTGDYEKLTANKYLTSDAYLKRGDILIKSGHTVMVLENGAKACAVEPPTKSAFAVGDIVKFTGTKHYASSNSANGKTCKPGKAKVTALANSGKHSVHLVAVTGGGSNVYGWVDTAFVVADNTNLAAGAQVQVKAGAKTYTGGSLASFVYKNTYDVISIDGDKVVIGKGRAVTAAMNKRDLIVV